MSVRTKLLSWRNINTDSDFSKYIETVSEPWVIEGLAVSTNSVAVGKCWCPCERTNWETIYALVESFSAETIDTSWTGYVIVTIGQNYIDDWSLINEDWTWVATIEVVSELPTKNYLLLATLTSGSITDSRNMIKKVWELNTAIESLTAYVNDINERVEALEAAWAIDHLEEQALVWERYNSTSQSMFVQKTPALADCTVEDCHVWDTAANTEIHIQRIANWTESNKLKLKVKMEWSPTTALKVEVRKWVQVNVSNTEAYWYWDESQILATWSLAYSEFSTAWAEKEFTLDNAISVDKWTLLDIVVYQESSWTKVVNASNYYKLACDSTQWSEAFSFVSVNGSTRTRSKLMPYCISWSFAQSLLSKVNADWLKRWNIPFWLPKDTYTVWETWYIITYWIIRTSFISKDVYVNTSWTVTDSSTNQFSYLGVSNAYWDVLFNWQNAGKKKTRAEGSTFWEFINFCKSYWTQHTGSSWYTMKWYWWISWNASSSNTSTQIQIYINNVDVAHHGAWSTMWFNAWWWPISLHPWDTVSWSNTWALLYDYY